MSGSASFNSVDRCIQHESVVRLLPVNPRMDERIDDSRFGFDVNAFVQRHVSSGSQHNVTGKSNRINPRRSLKVFNNLLSPSTPWCLLDKHAQLGLHQGFSSR